MTRSKNTLAVAETRSEKKSARSKVSARKPKKKSSIKTGTYTEISTNEIRFNQPVEHSVGYLQPLPDEGKLPDGTEYKLTRLDQPAEDEVLCEECATPIPPARLKLVKKHICVDCMRELERKGKGTVLHRMDVDTVGDIDDIEEVRVSIVRGE